MNIYLVARWGNDEEGPDGKDTLYLVAAKTHFFAAFAAEEKLKQLPHNRVKFRANWICLLGVAYSKYKGVLKGPYYDLSGIESPSTIWIREPWQKKWHLSSVDTENPTEKLSG